MTSLLLYKSPPMATIRTVASIQQVRVNELGNFSTYYHAAEKHLCVILQSFFAIPFSFRRPHLLQLE